MALERASCKDLKQFFDQWLYQGGNIKLKGSWHYDALNKSINLELDQVQPEKYNFDMPLEIGISTEENTPQQIETILLDKRKIKVSIPSENKPKSIELDPKIKLLAQWEFSQKK